MAIRRKSGGRTKGTPNKASAARAAAIAVSGLTPLDFAIATMRRYAAKAEAWEQIADDETATRWVSEDNLRWHARGENDTTEVCFGRRPPTTVRQAPGPSSESLQGTRMGSFHGLADACFLTRYTVLTFRATVAEMSGTN